MSTQEIIRIIQLSVPLYVSLICGLLHLRMLLMNDSTLGRKPLRLAIFGYMTSTFVWLSIIFYVSMPQVFVFVNPFLLLSYMIIHIIYYHFIFEMTRIEEKEKFSIIHYLIPLFIGSCMLVWSLFIPFDIQLFLVESDGLYIEKYKLYSIFFSSKTLIFFIWNIIYALLGLKRVISFRKIIVNYSADEQRTSFTWLYQFLFAMLTTIPLAIVAIFLSEDHVLPSWLIYSFIIVIIFKDIIFAHNVLLDNFVIIKTDADYLELQEDEIDQNTYESVKRKDIKKLETYINNNKPYLNPKLKITDITRELGTNRTSLSLLINRTYGVNFSRYINRFRLKELERIKKDPVYAGFSELELVIHAGFSDYRGYRRVKQREEILDQY